ncbi:MAG: zf-HC2 domain-containing protein [Spirochaetales bacterium]|nr:zf-HC2 domain-containing protein [Spirochaetales bacterium]
MCIDGQTLSAYMDNELDSSKSLIIRDHLEICSTCRESADSFNSLRSRLKYTNPEVNSFSKEAVWARLAHSTSTDKGLDFWHRGFVIAPSLMVSLSFLFIAVLGTGIFFAIPKNSNIIFPEKNSGSAFNHVNFPLDIPVDNVEKILAYFDIHDEPMEVFIQLPGSSDFIIQGEPRFLKKNDYIAGR